MREIFFFIISTIFIITGCASVEVAKEATKASKVIENSFKNLFKPPDEKDSKVDKVETVLEEKQEILKEDEIIKQKILVEKQEILKEQKKMSSVIIKQKEIAAIDLSRKTLKELIRLIGHPNLIREDRKTSTARFDSKNCRLFVFMDSTLKEPLVEYYELRNSLGELIDHEKNIRSCFRKIKIG